MTTMGRITAGMWPTFVGIGAVSRTSGCKFNGAKAAVTFGKLRKLSEIGSGSRQKRSALFVASLEDANDRRRSIETALRDVSYFSQRLASAQVVAESAAGDKVAFGNTVSFIREDRRRQRYKIVGEDEADPKTGTIAYVSPVARALLGKSVGDTVTVGNSELTITEIT